MSKGTKKGRSTTERRKHPRKTKAISSTPEKVERLEKSEKVKRPPLGSALDEGCQQCSKVLSTNDRALYVEEEIGRIFCSEPCITKYFQSEISKLEARYHKLRPKNDLTPEEREQYAHLRWITLQEADEVWRAKTGEGDYRYTLISEFTPGERPVFCVCICLFLQGEPSFLYLAFPTQSKTLVDHFRQGEKIEWVKGDAREAFDTRNDRPATDQLAEEWTESETLRAEIHTKRGGNDIPPEEFGLYEEFTEKTLQEPDELWILEGKDDGEPDVYQFIRNFHEDAEAGKEGLWYVIVAQEAEDEESLEVVEQFPTRLSSTVARFRKGRQELDPGDLKTPTNRTVH